MLDEEEYLKALVELNDDSFNEKNWLIKNFKLYKSTLVWPFGLPPISNTNLTKGHIDEKFNSVYYEILSEFDYELDNKKQTLSIKDKKI